MKPRSSKFQSCNKLPEIFELPDTDTVYGSASSFAKQSSSSLLSNHLQTSNENTSTKYDLQPQSKKFYCLFIQSPSSPDK